MAPIDLKDSYGRTVRDLRISVTDRCNFRCTYCMPEEGMQWLPRSELLTFEEITRLARLFVERFGVDGLRLTGGEPTVRAHLELLIAGLAELRVPKQAAGPLAGKAPDIAITTNGATFGLLAHQYRAAGLRRVNVSLDTLRPDRFHAITRRAEFHRVLDGIDAAIEAEFDEVKVNAVIERGVNEDEIVDLADFGRERGVQIRFIEFMPLDADGGWGRTKVVTQEEILAALSAVHPLEAVPGRGAAPADRWRYVDGRGEVGIIPSVSHPFCGNCDRVRLTAEGQFRTCLFATDETDLRGLMRAGASDSELVRAIQRAVGEKWAGHAIGRVTFVRPRRSMSQIGG